MQFVEVVTKEAAIIFFQRKVSSYLAGNCLPGIVFCGRANVSPAMLRAVVNGRASECHPSDLKNIARVVCNPKHSPAGYAEMEGFIQIIFL